MEPEKIIIFDAHEPSIICALSYFLDQGYELKSAPPERIETLWNNPNIWLLNVKYSIFGAKKDFDFFLDFHQDRIISLQDLIDFDENSNLSQEAQVFLKGWKKELSLIDLAHKIGDPKTWGYSKMAARYGKALISSRTLNSHKIHENRMISAAREISNKKENFEIIDLSAKYPQISQATKKALEKIFIKNSDFSIPNREVAYGFLDNLSPLADFYAIKQEALKNFSYLTVIQFRDNNQEFTWLGSKNINIRQLFGINKTGNQQEVLLKGKFKEINKNFRKIISEIII